MSAFQFIVNVSLLCYIDSSTNEREPFYAFAFMVFMRENGRFMGTWKRPVNAILVVLEDSYFYIDRTFRAFFFPSLQKFLACLTPLQAAERLIQRSFRLKMQKDDYFFHRNVLHTFGHARFRKRDSSANASR